MNRAGYSEDLDQWSLICWRGAVKSALRGARGQAFLRELLRALDALPAPELIDEELEMGGKVCALGAVGKLRGINMDDLDPYDREGVSRVFNIAEAMAAEIMYENDEAWRVKTPRQRWEHIRAWAIEHLDGDLESTR